MRVKAFCCFIIMIIASPQDVEAASWLSCKLSGAYCAKYKNSYFNPKEIEEIVSLCRDSATYPYSSFRSPSNHFAEFQRNYFEFRGHAGASLLWEKGLRFTYQDGAADPVKNANTVLDACNDFIVTTNNPENIMNL
jgi:hypothetical protein